MYGSSDDNIPSGSIGSGNLTGTDPGFVSVPAVGTVTGFDYSYDYCLREDSPARGAGGGGVDLGLYPVHGREFSLRGEPERPFTMTVIPSNAVIPMGGSTNVSFTIRQGNLSGGCTGVVGSTPVCRARISATEYKNFMCYNLGAANTSADPFTPGWEVNGGYWQWGRGVQAAAGPTGPGADQANEGSVSGWNTAIAANGSWSDTYKTGDDPCPAGYRVPTQTQWQAVHSHNTQTALGTWYFGGYTNYSAGVMFGSELMLPAAGDRDSCDGAL
jgi:hypothetical protein